MYAQSIEIIAQYIVSLENKQNPLLLLLYNPTR
jgi:hypothetical protein